MWGGSQPAAAAPAATAAAPAGAITTATATAAAKIGASSSFFSTPLAPPPPVAAAAAATAAVSTADDLEKYLALPPVTNMDVDVLAWWKARDHNLQADPASGRPEGLPALAKMVRQFLVVPRSPCVICGC